METQTMVALPKEVQELQAIDWFNLPIIIK